MKIVLAADHAGFALKQRVVDYLKNKGYEVHDLGVTTDTTVADYPDIAILAGQAIQEKEAERAILICGSGVGACIAANKMIGVYAAICHDTYSAAQGVQHDNMNVLCLGGLIIGTTLAERICDAFLTATFDVNTERYVRRFDKVRHLESH